MLRPIIEYCNVVYHVFITNEQSESLERFQKMALKVIFGFGVSYPDLLLRSGIDRLDNRRIIAFEKFTRNLVKNERYSSEWFPLKPSLRDFRSNKKYEELHARTDRLYNSPLYKMRRLLNQEETEES